MFEKYILRAVIYKQICAEEQLANLSNDFNATFGQILQGIKLGKALSSYPELRKIGSPQGARRQKWEQTRLQLDGLKAEAPQISSLSSRVMADFLYRTEIKNLEQQASFSRNDQLSSAAEQLLLTSESLAFLRFEMQRASVDPSHVFQAEKRREEDLLRPSDSDPDQAFTVTWKANGDYWRTERPLYNALIEDGCRK